MNNNMTGYDLHKVSVLIIEPQWFMRKILSDILNELGIHTIFIAENIKEGLSRYKEFSPDIILTDWSPALNAIHLVKAIRQAPGSPNPFVPIVIVTANTDIHHVFTARDAGMTEFLIKPIRIDLLYARIQSVIEKQRVFVKAPQFFGPDRRRRHIQFNGGEKRTHSNMNSEDRRQNQNAHSGPERRHGLANFIPPEKRADSRM